MKKQLGQTLVLCGVLLGGMIGSAAQAQPSPAQLHMQQQQQNQTRRQGDVTVERPDMKQKQYKREQGEYVDFEEVD